MFDSIQNVIEEGDIDMAKINDIYTECVDPTACPVETTLKIIGGKWKTVILYHLLNKTIRFNEFQRIMPDISQRMLTRQLRELEKDGIIHRKVYNEIPPKVEYSMTEFGYTLKPIILSMRDWGEGYIKTFL